MKTLEQKEPFCHLQKRGRHLIIYQDLLADPLYRAFLNLLEALCENGSNPELLYRAARDFFVLLVEAGVSELGQAPLEDHPSDPWTEHVLNLISAADNVFTRQAARGGTGVDYLEESLLQAARQDLGLLQAVAEAGPAVYLAAGRRLTELGVSEKLPDLFTAGQARFPSDSTGVKTDQRAYRSGPVEARRELKRRLAHERWDGTGLELLKEYHAAYGAGLFGRFWAFRWVRGKDGGALEGIANPDPVGWADLVGYEKERAEIRQNTEKFLRGLPANNVLLYGARGTGKSSTVKGLLHLFGHRGLRLIELPKRYLNDYQELLKRVEDEPYKFIIFIDDLSFEADEVEYKELKGLLEGSLQARPANVLVYATSNRRHLVKEYFGDRDQAGTSPPSQMMGRTANGEEVRGGDTVQEKLSLAERFGLTVIFFSPDQEDYLSIVHELAARRGLDIEEGELRRLALRWALFQNGTSGRTARQFVDHLYGELALKKEPQR